VICGLVDDGLALARQVRTDAERAGLPRFVAFGAEQEVEWLIWDGQFTEAEALFEEACLPAKQHYRDRWMRITLLLARGEARPALALEEEGIAAGTAPAGVGNSPRLIDACEQVSDHQRMLATAQALLATTAHTDSPLRLAQAASCSYRAMVAARAAGVQPAEALARLAADALDLARRQATSQWSQTWYGMHLALAEAYEAQLARLPAIAPWRSAAEIASRFGRYTALRPHLELARELLAHGAREEGKELLISLRHDAHAMGARWYENQATLGARRFRVPLPHVDAGSGPLNVLTPREREVLDLVSTGATDRAIATALFITEKTASTHVGRVLAKLGVANRGQAAAVARAADAATIDGQER
jgi:DNA-binding CsgD family transcriptional regulator